MEKLTDFFELMGFQVISIVGSGGKTSLLWRLAENKRLCKTLAATTTRMLRPASAQGLYDYLISPQTIPLCAENGITLAGCEDNGKFKSLPPELLEKIIPLFDYVFIEADGSRMLPLKAWADYEPVITPSTTVTVGIMPLLQLGLPVSEKIIHRLPLFTALTGAQEGAPLKLEHLVKVITGSGGQGGIFKSARGRKILFFNQIENEAALQTAQKLTSILPQDFMQELYAVIAGSVQKNYAATILRGF